MTDELQQLSADFMAAFDSLSLQLLGEAEPREPKAPPVPQLLDHAATALELSQNAVRLAVALTDTPEAKSREEAKAHRHLSTAAAEATSAAHLFTRSVETSLSPAPAPESHAARTRGARLLLDCADAGAGLRRAAESLTAANRLLEEHRAIARFAAKFLPRQPIPQPPGRTR
ncbi:hypothetical protein ACQPZG_31760 [Streptomyces sp. CA-294286]|uniref:hypothetical protein n=1 Tax=Streptomyces sp. CA-294286 TaxID=3240070 RepID=UPI003D8F5D7E